MDGWIAVLSVGAALSLSALFPSPCYVSDPKILPFFCSPLSFQLNPALMVLLVAAAALRKSSWWW
jgi:hypothetical protein